MNKKVSAKKNRPSVKFSLKKSTQPRSHNPVTSKPKNPMTSEPKFDAKQKLRKFWGLFDKVKNHNFQMMVQPNNDLNDFIRVVEEMSDPIFQHIFVNELDLTHVRHSVYVGCGCPEGPQCFCKKHKTVGVSNVFYDYLKTHDLQKYEIEIQHLRHLMVLQDKGKVVPTSYSIEDLLKRSNYIKPDPINTSHYTQSSLGIEDTVVKDESFNISSLSSDLEKSVESHLNLTSLKEVEKKELETTCESYKEDCSSMRKALQNLTKYASILEENNPNQFTKTDEQKLPQFWQELKAAREVFENFNKFYARKYADYVDSLRDMNKKEQEYLVSDKPSDKHLLQENVLRHLNAQKDLEVMKKILSSAYEAFRKTDIVQAETTDLKKDMAKYSNKSYNEFVGLFNHLTPHKKGPFYFKHGKKIPLDVSLGNHLVSRSILDDSHKKMQASFSEELIKNFKEVKASDDDQNHMMVSEASKLGSAERKAEAIHKMVLKDIINPYKDFPELIKNGMSAEAVELWKKKYSRDFSKAVWLTDAESAAIDDSTMHVADISTYKGLELLKNRI